MPDNATIKKPSVNIVNKLFYGIGDFGFNMVINTLGSVMMYFGTTVCNIPGTLMGLAIAIAMVWDAITDPIAGNLSDGINNLLFGKRHGFMLMGIFGISIVNVMLWSLPMGLPVWGKFLWIVSFLMLLRTFSTMYQTPAAALGVEITSNINERTQIQSIRAIFLIIAIIVPVIIMGVFEGKYGLGDPKIYKDVAYINGAVCLICGVIAVMGTYSYLPRLRRATSSHAPSEKFSLKKIFKSFFEALRDNNVKSIVGGYTASLMSIVFLSSLMIHVLQFTFMIDDIFVLLGSVFLMTILSQPLWIFLSKRFDKKFALFTGIITALVGTVGLFAVYLFRLSLIESGGMFWALLPFLSLMGAGAGAMYSMPLSMLGDTIAYKFRGKGEFKTGAYTGYTTLANKMSQSITLMIIGVLLDVVGFDGAEAVQTAPVQWALGAILIGGIAAALVGGLFFYRKYSLTKEDILNITEPQRETAVEEDFI